jgi:hypothetical protein
MTRALRLLVALVVLLSLVTVAGAEPRGAPPQVLPLRRLRLYETGVGYFERSGRISAQTRLPIPSAQLDDALASLVVLGGGKNGQLESVRFDTLITEQLGRALARLPTDDGTALDFEALTRSLTGMEVELVSAGRTQRGRLLQVLSADSSGLQRCVPAQVPEAKCVLRGEPGLMLLSERDELMRFALADVQRVRPVRAADADRLWSAFSSTAQRARAEHELQLNGQISEEVTLGYVAEAPLWRTSYRMVLHGTGATLQLWSLLHNDGDEDWRRVQVELVSGQPDSFLFPLAAPRYARRRLITPDEQLPSVPQLLSRGADERWDQGDDEENIGFGGIGLTGYGTGAGGFHGRDAVSGPAESSLLAIGDLTQHAEASTVQSGALFRYVLPEPIDLPAHQSLLVPLLRADVPVERVSYFADDTSTAQSALLFRNATKQTLPSGTVAIFEDGGFGGESAFDRLDPGEQRLLPFGLDLDLELKRDKAPTKSGAFTEKQSSRDIRRAVRFENGELFEHFERVEQRSYRAHNRSGQPRRVHLALSVVNNSRVEQADAVLALDDGQVSAVYDVAAGSTRELSLRIVQGLTERRPLSAALLRRLGTDANLPEGQRALLNKAAEQLAERDRAIGRGKQLAGELELLAKSAERMRESLPLVAKADAGRGRSLAADLVETEALMAKTERARGALDPSAGERAAKHTLAQLK